MARFYKAALSFVFIYCIVLIAIGCFQRSFLYFPSDVYLPPQEARAEQFQEIKVKTEDGLDLKGWYVPASGKPFTIIFFHGNGDSLLTAYHVADPYIAAGYGFFLAEYRGYSGLPGMPTEKGLYADARSYVNKLIATGLKEEDIIFMGHSLGTGVATQMAKEFDSAGLILFAPYLSMAKMAAIRFPFFPAEHLVMDKYDNYEKIAEIKEPLLIISGEADRVIPPDHGKKLFEIANQPKEFFLIRGRGHNDLFDDAANIVLKWNAIQPLATAQQHPD